jgi:hypothetical protein
MHRLPKFLVLLQPERPTRVHVANRRGARVVERARLEIVYPAKLDRGFESLPLRNVLIMS